MSMTDVGSSLNGSSTHDRIQSIELSPTGYHGKRQIPGLSPTVRSVRSEDGAAVGYIGDDDRIDLNFLSEAERDVLKKVIRRDLTLRNSEQRRLDRVRRSIILRDRQASTRGRNRVATSSLQSLASTCSNPSKPIEACYLCSRPFVLLLRSRHRCGNCQRLTCRRCCFERSGLVVTGGDGVVCLLCSRQIGYQAMSCNWYYDKFKQRFNQFGSSTVAKAILEVQDGQATDDDNVSVNTVTAQSTAPRSGTGSISNSRELIINDQKVTQESLNQTKSLHQSSARDKLVSLIQRAQHALSRRAAEQTTPGTHKHVLIRNKFFKECSQELRIWSRVLYLTAEKNRDSFGLDNNRALTKEITETIEKEVSHLVGYDVHEDAEQKSSGSSTEDLDSLAYVARECFEDRLAKILWIKVIGDSMNSSPEVKTSLGSELIERMTVAHGTPVRLSFSYEYLDGTGYVCYLNQCHNWTPRNLSGIATRPPRPRHYTVRLNYQEFTWYKQNSQGHRRLHVHAGRHVEHVIACRQLTSQLALQPDQQSPPLIILSNSGTICQESIQHLALLARNARVKQTSLIIHHELCIWSAGLTNTGTYYGVLNKRCRESHRRQLLEEREFRLDVRESLDSIPNIRPTFHQQLLVDPPSIGQNRSNSSLITDNQTDSTVQLQLSCVVMKGRPEARILFYFENTPIPISLLPCSESAFTSYASLSGKYKLTVGEGVPHSPPDEDDPEANRYPSWRLKLTIVNPSSQRDAGVYSCRVWNEVGSVETSFHFDAAQIKKLCNPKQDMINPIVRTKPPLPPPFSSPTTSQNFDSTALILMSLQQQIETLEAIRYWMIQKDDLDEGIFSDRSPSNRSVDKPSTIRSSTLPGRSSQFPSVVQLGQTSSSSHQLRSMSPTAGSDVNGDRSMAPRRSSTSSQPLNLMRWYKRPMLPNSLRSASPRSKSNNPFKWCLGRSPTLDDDSVERKSKTSNRVRIQSTSRESMVPSTSLSNKNDRSRRSFRIGRVIPIKIIRTEQDDPSSSDEMSPPRPDRLSTTPASIDQKNRIAGSSKSASADGLPPLSPINTASSPLIQAPLSGIKQRRSSSSNDQSSRGRQTFRRRSRDRSSRSQTLRNDRRVAR